MVRKLIILSGHEVGQFIMTTAKCFLVLQVKNATFMSRGRSEMCSMSGGRRSTRGGPPDWG